MIDDVLFHVEQVHRGEACAAARGRAGAGEVAHPVLGSVHRSASWEEHFPVEALLGQCLELGRRQVEDRVALLGVDRGDFDVDEVSLDLSVQCMAHRPDEMLPRRLLGRAGRGQVLAEAVGREGTVAGDADSEGWALLDVARVGGRCDQVVRAALAQQVAAHLWAHRPVELLQAGGAAELRVQLHARLPDQQVVIRNLLGADTKVVTVAREARAEQPPRHGCERREPGRRQAQISTARGLLAQLANQPARGGEKGLQRVGMLMYAMDRRSARGERLGLRSAVRVRLIGRWLHQLLGVRAWLQGE